MFRLLRRVAEGLAVLVAALYLTGFVVVTAYYARLGLPASLFSARYASAGFVPLVSIALAFVLVIISASWLPKPDMKSPQLFLNMAGCLATAQFGVVLLLIAGTWGNARMDTPRGSGMAWLLVGAGLEVVSVALRLRCPRMSPKFPRWLFNLFIMVSLWPLSVGLTYAAGYGYVTAWVSFVAVLATLSWALNRIGALQFGSRWRENLRTKWGLLLVLAPPLLVFLLVFYGLTVYPSIPQFAGGGNPSMAALLVRSDTSTELTGDGRGGTCPQVDTVVCLLIERAGGFAYCWEVKPDRSTRVVARNDADISKIIFLGEAPPLRALLGNASEFGRRPDTSLYPFISRLEASNEGRVRLIMLDMTLDSKAYDGYKRLRDSLKAGEAIRRWDKGVRVVNADRFQRKNVNGVWRLTHVGTDVLVDGLEVKLSSD